MTTTVTHVHGPTLIAGCCNLVICERWHVDGCQLRRVERTQEADIEALRHITFRSWQKSDMSDCQHEDFNASVEINRLSDTEDGPVNSLAIELRVQCASCGKPVRFEGPIGMAIGRGAQPCVSLDGLELRAAGHMGNNDTPLMGFMIRREQ